MKKLYCVVAGMLVVLGLSFLPPATYGLAPQEILEKAAEAKGGRKLLDSIKDVIITERWGGRYRFIQYYKAPDKSRSERWKDDVLSKVLGYNGKIRWQHGGGGLADAEYEKNQLEDWNLIYRLWIEKPEKLGYLGIEEVEGRDAFGIILSESRTMAQGYLTIESKKFFFDGQSFLLVKMEQKGEDRFPQYGAGRFTRSFFFSDYRRVDGILTAHKRRLVFRPKKGKGGSNVQTMQVRYNMGLEDSFFESPGMGILGTSWLGSWAHRYVEGGVPQK